MSDSQTPSAAKESQAANLFDLRRIIAGLFGVYGVVLTIVGLTDSPADIHKSVGVHVNLLAGLGMIVLAALFAAWALWRPLGKQLAELEEQAPRGDERRDPA